MMISLSGESLIGRHVEADWEDELQARAILRASAYKSCRELLHLGGPVDDYSYAIVVDDMPAILELQVCLSLDICELRIRCPGAAESAARALLDRIVEEARVQCGATVAESPILVVEDELPF